MPHKVIDENVAALATEAIKSKQETIRTVSAKLGIYGSLARFVSSQAEMDSSPGPPTVLSVAEAAATEDLLVYIGIQWSRLQTFYKAWKNFYAKEEPNPDHI